MTNFQVYRKTLSFSFAMFGAELLAFIAFIGCATAGFFIFYRTIDMALIGLLIGVIIGIVAAVLINIFLVNRIKAAQIAMMAIGVTENQLPEHTFKEGFNQLKGRFGKLTAFFFIMNAIKSIFHQIGRAFTRVGEAVGGQVGGSVTSVIDSAVQTLIAYLCDCCLGWVMYNKDTNMARAACEGAVIFFKNGKTLIRNIGRIFGMSILSFVLFGGAFFGGFFALFYFVPNMSQGIVNEIAKMAASSGDTVPEILSQPTLFNVVAAAVLAVVLWCMFHSVLGRPFILVGVLRNFMAAGLKNKPQEGDFAVLDSRSPKFAKLHNSI